MASPSQLQRLILKLAGAEKKQAQKNITRDTHETVPKVFKPSDDIPLDADEADTFFGPTRSELDREELVLEQFEIDQAANPNVRRSGSIEQELNDIERRLLEEGQLEDIIPELNQRTEFDQFKGKPDTISAEEAKQVETFIDPRLPPSATHFRELENLDRFLKGEKEVPITRSQREGSAKGAGERIETKKRSDDIDVLNERREARLAEFKKHLEANPELDTPANRAILTKDVIEADIADKAAGQVFGKDKDAFPKDIDPESRLDEFSLRELEDIFGRNDLSTPQGRAVARFRKEAAQAAARSGRPPEPGARQLLPTGAKSFANRPRPDASELDAVQDKLTGPLKPEAKEKELQRILAQREKTAKLKAQRLKKEK